MRGGEVSSVVRWRAERLFCQRISSVVEEDDEGGEDVFRILCHLWRQESDLNEIKEGEGGEIDGQERPNENGFKRDGLNVRSIHSTSFLFVGMIEPILMEYGEMIKRD